MKSPLVAAMFALSAAFPAIADVLEIKKDAPKQYVVKKGDTLWGISDIYLSDSWLWPKLWEMNSHISNPHLIYPGDALTLVYGAGGTPRLVLNKAYKKLSPKGYITAKGKDAVTTLPLELIKPYLTYEQALNNEEIDGKPYVLGANQNTKTQTLDHILYVNGDLKLNQAYAIYHKGEAYTDPDTNEILANRASYAGMARVFRRGDISNGIPSSVRVESVKREIKQGDFLLPAMQGQTLPAYFNMHRPKQPLEGKVIASANHVREFSTMDIVVLNLGAEQQIEPGHVLDIERQSPGVIDGQRGPRYPEDSSKLERLISSTSELLGLEPDENSTVWSMPKEKVGELIVFKVYDKVSYALITKNQHPIRVGDFAVIH
ncbi:LysM peptidoglycan-binding domain-containing protein [Pseudoalteromonas sp. SG45-5]|uniref:LysM peptidoglycan-binding domain-containing protein n=1 Tax=unclassified Pseudoalteromonas TaxID=194690 RepID=UPI0015F78A24|nr:MULTISPECIES: LysM peptidoglycan-binding domain-containing protein [unclassified Pseudoalteromonas]MBB1385540.1 LysM peptidoglycan-binding domain-containing protein [Pseudoalteromonas sp. SG45-5]MBB1393466.1 LysM peptidoglycan-binding domain-containing protein [Pseudoalteromonas sp. SG44-4]MBB1445890.1 LysM peptidoglycan-binding domain-containing protein [Pseudoalteromonas sp. SG41-6]